jgi:hypothetical protein
MQADSNSESGRRHQKPIFGFTSVYIKREEKICGNRQAVKSMELMYITFELVVINHLWFCYMD